MKKRYLFLLLLAMAGTAHSQQRPIHVSELKQHPELMTHEQLVGLRKAGIDEQGFLPPPASLAGYNLLDSMYRYDVLGGDLGLWEKIYYENDCQSGLNVYKERFRWDGIPDEFKPVDREYWSYFPNGAIKTNRLNYYDEVSDTWLWLRYDTLVAPFKTLERWDKYWNPSAQQFSSGSRLVYERNANGDETLVTEQDLNEDIQDWRNVLRSSYTYDANGYPSLRFVEAWDDQNSEWFNYYEIAYTYDSEGKILQYIRKDYTGNISEPVYRYTYTYDANGNNTLISFEQYDASLGVYNEDSRTSFNYDANNQAVSSLVEVYDGGDWINSSKWDATYHPNGILATRDGYDWDIDSGTWLQTQKEILNSEGEYTYYEYKSDYDASTGGFGFGFRVNYDFNAMNLLTQIKFDFLLFGTFDTWSLSNFDTYEYDANNRTLEIVYRKYDAAISDYAISGKDHYYNTGCFYISDTDEPAAANDQCAHANPLRPGQPIQCTAAIGTEPAQLELYALNGVRMHHQAFRAGEGIEPSRSLPNGMYLLLVKGQNGTTYRSKLVWMN